tara:strand:+ start:463 stop:642 length:180 start_codon:yes stop_codon:yes gene_type:complete
MSKKNNAWKRRRQAARDERLKIKHNGLRYIRDEGKKGQLQTDEKFERRFATYLLQQLFD